MMLSNLVKQLKDMGLLYGEAIVYVDVDGKKRRIISTDGFVGEKRPNECRDPNFVVIKTKEVE